VETEFLVETLGSYLVSLVKIDDLPSLVGIVTLVVISTIDNNSLAFFVLSISDFKDLVIGWINKVLSLEFEYLEPS
jgi:hypothetical protein